VFYKIFIKYRYRKSLEEFFMLAALPVNTLITTDNVPIFCQNLEKNISASTELKKMKMIFFTQFNRTTIDCSFADRPLPTPQEYYEEFCQEARKAPFNVVIPAFDDPETQKGLATLHQKNLIVKERFLEAKKNPLKSQLEPAIIESLKRGLEEVHPTCLKNLFIEVTFAQKNALEQDLSICFEGNPTPEKGSLVNLFRLSPPSRFKRLVLNPLKKMANVVSALFKRLAAILTWPLRYTRQKPTEGRGISSNTPVAPGYSYRQGDASAVTS